MHPIRPSAPSSSPRKNEASTALWIEFVSGCMGKYGSLVVPDENTKSAEGSDKDWRCECIRRKVGS